ncbi:DUF397 domain-containing protein [Streptomyces sp. NPDC002599]|uniref:DUF397 domain-containing protein n=1 Tax=Streptomyces sp. NPDC002599 TaxID=3154421 RepID=UPI00331FBBF7
MSGDVWRKSSHSGAPNGDCVEVAVHGQRIRVRDSKCPQMLFMVSCGTWQELVAALKAKAVSL